MLLSEGMEILLPSDGNTRRTSTTNSKNFSWKLKTLEDLKELTLFDVETECWEWQKGRTSEGYGRANKFGKPIDAHRLAWILSHPDDLLLPEDFVCHSCDNPACCNPKHLFLGSTLINNRDSKNKNRRYGQKLTHCSSGHPKTEENMDPPKGKYGARDCKLCRRLRNREQYWNNQKRLLGDA